MALVGMTSWDVYLAVQARLIRCGECRGQAAWARGWGCWLAREFGHASVMLAAGHIYVDSLGGHNRSTADGILNWPGGTLAWCMLR